MKSQVLNYHWKKLKVQEKMKDCWDANAKTTKSRKYRKFLEILEDEKKAGSRKQGQRSIISDEYEFENQGTLVDVVKKIGTLNFA